MHFVYPLSPAGPSQLSWGEGANCQFIAGPHRKTNNHSQITHSYIQFSLCDFLWDVGERRNTWTEQEEHGNPKQKCPRPGDRTRNLLWGNSTVINILILKINSYIQNMLVRHAKILQLFRRLYILLQLGKSLFALCERQSTYTHLDNFS